MMGEPAGRIWNQLCSAASIKSSRESSCTDATGGKGDGGIWRTLRTWEKMSIWSEETKPGLGGTPNTMWALLITWPLPSLQRSTGEAASCHGGSSVAGRQDRGWMQRHNQRLGHWLRWSTHSQDDAGVSSTQGSDSPPGVQPKSRLKHLLHGLHRKSLSHVGCFPSNTTGFEKIYHEECDKLSKSLWGKLVETYPRRPRAPTSIEGASTKSWIKVVYSFTNTGLWFFISIESARVSKNIFPPCLHGSLKN